jgi:Cytochrome bd terminal oxidase subunit I
MDLDPVLLSRIQFAFVVSFHIIFPAFTIGLAAWLATIEGMHIATRDPIYRRVFNFWLKVFALSFGMGVVSGIVMAFQFGTNWSVLAERTGSIQGPLLGYEGFTAHAGGDVLRRDAARPRSRAAMVLFPVVLHGFCRNYAVVILDPLQQQLDAGADRSRHS